MFLKKRKYSLYKSDFIIAIIIIFLPFLFYLYLLIPIKESIDVFNVTFQFSEGWDMEFVLWVLFSKLMILLIFSLWFISCQHWWRYAIFSVIYMSIRHIYAVIKFAIDEHEKHINEWAVLLISLPVFLFLIYFSNKHNYYQSKNKISKKLTEDIDKILNDSGTYSKTNYSSYLLNFKALIKARSTLNQKEYLHSLLEFKHKLNNHNLENK